MADLPMIPQAVTCDGCSDCCQHVGSPPFLLDCIDGVIQRLDADASRTDYESLMAAPAEAQAAYVEHRLSSDGPCVGLDSISRRCRYYEFRPDICRNFEVGGRWCVLLRGSEEQ